MYAPGKLALAKTTGDRREHYVTREQAIIPTPEGTLDRFDPDDDPSPYVRTTHGEILRVTDHATSQATIGVNEKSVSDDPAVTEYTPAEIASLLGSAGPFDEDTQLVFTNVVSPIQSLFLSPAFRAPAFVSQPTATLVAVAMSGTVDKAKGEGEDEAEEPPWGRDPDIAWTADQAWVTAQMDDASLFDLAMYITGNPADVVDLLLMSPHNAAFVSGPIKAGNRIDVTPLLRLLEERIRQTAADVALGAKNAKFGSSTKRANTYTEAMIRAVFDKNMAGKIKVRCDCRNMAELIVSYAIITHIGKDDFHDLIRSPQVCFERIWCVDMGHVGLHELKLGDIVYFRNCLDYGPDDGTMSGQWTIKTALGRGGYDGGRFWGFDLGERTEIGWRKVLRNFYDKLINPYVVIGMAQLGSPELYHDSTHETTPLTSIIGYRDARALDIGLLAQILFDFRTTGAKPFWSP